MSKKLHGAALTAAVLGFQDRQSTSIRFQLDGAIAAYLAHLKAHGWRLTPREPSADMHTNARNDACPADLEDGSRGEPTWRLRFRIQWRGGWDAAPDFPGDAA